MKNTIIVLLIVVSLFSCKKEKPFNPDDTITYTYWYQLKSNGVDTMFWVFIPNAFTPNGDGINDEFYPKGEIGYVSNYKIYNKSDNLIYFAPDVNSHWNGRFNNIGEPQEIGVYMYKIMVTPPYSSEQYERSGSVMLYR
jgi:gliding motility-associated-like protein